MVHPDQTTLPAAYLRGGTSRAIFFHTRDLPEASAADGYAAWAPIFLSAIGSPDPYGRQLNGMGGGISSLSKIAVIGPSTRSDADVDYTFAQVGVNAPAIGYRGNCGNISSAVGPFAVDEGLVSARGESATVRIHNTNTGKVIHATFPLESGKAKVTGDYILEGVAGSGAPIRLDFLDPTGAATGALFPTQKLSETLSVPGAGDVEVTLIDSSNPLVLLDAAALGLTAFETASQLAANDLVMEKVKALRISAAIGMGLAADVNEATSTVSNLPLVGCLSRPDGDATINVRMFSSDQPHKASPITAAMCLAVATRLRGTVASKIVGAPIEQPLVRISHASGNIDVTAELEDAGVESKVTSTGVFRTARRLMDGKIYVGVPEH